MIDGGRVWLIRHGQSESNAGLPTNGPGAAPLTALGRAQAEQAAAALPEAPALIVSSTFARARETARPARERFPTVPYEEWPVQEFTYLGALHGPRTTNEQRRPYAAAYWDRADPAHVNGGDGESFQELITRTRAFLDRLTAHRLTAHRPDGLVAVFTHGIFMRALMWSLLTGVTTPDSADMRAFHRFLDVCLMPNGAIVELHPGGRDGFRLVGGTITHLEPTVPAPRET